MTNIKEKNSSSDQRGAGLGQLHGARLVSRWAELQICSSSPFSSKGVTLDHHLVAKPSHIRQNKQQKRLAASPAFKMQFCSGRDRITSNKHIYIT